MELREVKQEFTLGTPYVFYEINGLCHGCNKFYKVAYTQEDPLIAYYIKSDQWGINRMNIFAFGDKTLCPSCGLRMTHMFLYEDMTHDPAYWHNAKEDLENKVKAVIEESPK